MKQTAVEWLIEQMNSQKGMLFECDIKHAKEIEEKNLLDMLHKFGFDYTYNYKGEKTIYEWIPEWFEEYKRLEQFKKK
jgi:hypothetical protein